MTPSITWFPSSLADRAAWMQNFADQFPIYSMPLGLAAYNTAVDVDNEDFQSIAATRVAARNFDRAISDYLRELTEGDVGDPQPIFPAGAFSPTPNGRPAGMFERLDELRTLIMAQPTFTEAIGTAMGIVGSPVQGVAPGDVKPEIAVFPAAHNYMFSIIVSKRYSADMWDVLVNPVGLMNWQVFKSATGKSTDVVYPPTGEIPGPVQLQVYVQLKRNNNDYGQPSDIALVTVNP